MKWHFYFGEQANENNFFSCDKPSFPEVTSKWEILEKSHTQW